MPLAFTQDDWLRRAELAVQKEEDELAKEALKRRKAAQVSGQGKCVYGGRFTVIEEEQASKSERVQEGRGASKGRGREREGVSRRGRV